MYQQRANGGVVVALILLNGLLWWAVGARAVADDAAAQPAAAWPPELQKKGYAPFLANTMQRLSETPAIEPREAIDSISISLAKGEYFSIQLGIYGIVGETSKVRVLVADIDLDVKIREVQRHARYPDHFKGKWVQAGYWAPTATLRLSKELDRVGEKEKRAFWITFHATSEATSGLRQGSIWLMPENRVPTEVKLKINVRPFTLPVARAAFGVYFPRGYLPPPASNDPRWLESIYRDMAEHAQNSVTFYDPGTLSVVPPKSNLYSESLPIAKKVGLIHPNVPCITMGGLHGTSPAATQAALAWRREQRQLNGWPELIEYGRDEPAYPNPEVRKSYTAFRNVPVRLVTAMGIDPGYGLGDLHDTWIVYAGQLTPQACAEARRLGAEPWTYSCHMLSGRIPPPHRYMAGLYTWGFQLKGAWQWAYHWYVWWDETDQVPRSSTEWENWRDGAQDYRYLQLVEDCVRGNPQHPLASAARKWLDALRQQIMYRFGDPHHATADSPVTLADYEKIRATATEYIKRLGVESAAKLTFAEPTGLKDEAAPYRDQPLAACIAAIQTGDVVHQRGAATAMFERGSEAAPATEALAALLDNPETCIPAARALDAIGPAAAASIPALAKMSKHEDGFVRLAALYALKSIGKVAGDNAATTQSVVAILRVTLLDPFHPVCKVSGDALISFGPASVAALPEAQQLKKRKYHLTKWPHAGLADKLIEAIGSDGD